MEEVRRKGRNRFTICLSLSLWSCSKDTSGVDIVKLQRMVPPMGLQPIIITITQKLVQK